MFFGLPVDELLLKNEIYTLQYICYNIYSITLYTLHYTTYYKFSLKPSFVQKYSSAYHKANKRQKDKSPSEDVEGLGLAGSPSGQFQNFYRKRISLMISSPSCIELMTVC